MSAQPVPMPAKDAVAKAKRRADLRSDLLYLAGAVLVTAGIGLIRVKFGLISGGCFCLLPPLLELAAGFIRGLRIQRR